MEGTKRRKPLEADAASSNDIHTYNDNDNEPFVSATVVNFASLPCDVHREVFRYLTLNELFPVCLVSRDWYIRAWDAQESVTCRGHQLSHVLKRTSKLHSLSIEQFSPKKLVKDIHRLGHLRSLRIQPITSVISHYDLAKLALLPSLRELALDTFLMSLLPPLPDLEVLVASAVSEAADPMTNLATFTSLRRIEVDARQPSLFSKKPIVCPFDDLLQLKELRYADFRLATLDDRHSSTFRSIINGALEHLPKLEQFTAFLSNSSDLLDILEANTNNPTITKMLMESTYASGYCTSGNIAWWVAGDREEPYIADRLFRLPGFRSSLMLERPEFGDTPIIRVIFESGRPDSREPKKWIQRFLQDYPPSAIPPKAFALSAKPNSDLAEWLLDQGMDPNATEPGFPETALTLLLALINPGNASACIALASRLVARGANPLYLCPGGYGVPSRVLAHIQAFEWYAGLPQVTTLSNITPRGGSVWHCFALDSQYQNLDYQVVSRLISMGINVDAYDADGFTPLGLACKYRHLFSATELIGCGANCSQKMQNGMSPLGITIRHHSDKKRLQPFLEKFAWTLIEGGADVLDTDPSTMPTEYLLDNLIKATGDTLLRHIFKHFASQMDNSRSALMLVIVCYAEYPSRTQKSNAIRSISVEYTMGILFDRNVLQEPVTFDNKTYSMIVHYYRAILLHFDNMAEATSLMLNMPLVADREEQLAMLNELVGKIISDECYAAVCALLGPNH